MNLSLEKISDPWYKRYIKLQGVFPMTKKTPTKSAAKFKLTPDLQKRIEAYVAKMTPEQKEENVEKLQKFLSGEITWAEVRHYPKALLKEVAKVAYFHYQKADYQSAELLFKGLAIIDHTNWYYRGALGAVYQKQKLYDEAIGEYDMALFLNEKEITTLTNRGECYLHLQDYGHALKDFEAAILLDSDNKNPWGKRARALKKKIVEEGHGESLGE